MKKCLMFILLIIAISTNLFAQDNKLPDLSKTEAVLRSRWNGMKEEVSRGNIDKALEYFVPMVRDKYREGFRILSGQMAAIFNQPEDLRLIEINGNVANCNMVVTEEDGKKHAYPTVFVLYDGVWMIVRF